MIALVPCSGVTGLSEKVVFKLIWWEKIGNKTQEGDDIFIFEKNKFSSVAEKDWSGDE